MKAVDKYTDTKLCWTSAGMLIVEGKILLVKHKLLGIWLAPGGHCEQDELPHQTAEREFWEETRIRVSAVPPQVEFQPTAFSQYVPNPILSNLHWMNRKNYDLRLAGQTDKVQGRGCEQHLCLIYLVKPVQGLEYQHNTEEVDDIGWFSQEAVMDLATTPDLKYQIQYAFKLI